MNDLSPARGTTFDGKKLRGLRRQRAWTQEHLAGIADVSDDTISRAERGQSVSLENAMAIAAAFNVDVASLIPAAAPSETDAPIEEARSVAMSNIPIRVPVHFMGRDRALAEIEEALARYEGRVAITALHGLRGVGKTVLAAAYAERHAKDYRATWWIRAETESGMRADLVGLGVRLGWVDPEEKEEPALAAVMERLTREGDGILLIYDNAVEADRIRPYLPRGGPARVLVTSNAHAWRGIAQPVEIRLWPKEIGADFLVARTGRIAERAAAEALSEALGGLPLAHEQAAAYCERLEIPLAEYTKRFAAEAVQLLDAGKDAPLEYHDKLTVARTFALAIEAAAAQHPAAEPLIVLCALLPPEPIPLFLYREMFGKQDGPFAGDGLDEGVAALRAFALIDRETVPDERDPAIATDCLRLHRLVREVAAARAGDTRERLLGVLIGAMASIYPAGVFSDPAAWLRARRLDALALALVADAAALSEQAQPAMDYLLNQLATYRQGALGAFAEAVGLYRRALESNERVLGAEHPGTLISANNLASCLESLGEAPAALPFYRRVLESREHVLGAEHPQTLGSVHNLAHCLQSLGDAAAALPLHRRALESRERVLGAEHPDTLGSFNNLAGCLQSLGDAAAALPLHRRALESSERVLGAEHPQTLSSVHNLAHCLGALDDAAAALPLHRRALESRERVLGAEHPDTLLSVNNLAYCLQTLGDAAAALPLYRRAVAGLDKVLGPEHPNTVIVRNNLAILEAEGR